MQRFLSIACRKVIISCLCFSFLLTACSNSKNANLDNIPSQTLATQNVKAPTKQRSVSIEASTKGIATQMLHDLALTQKNNMPSLLLGKTTNYTGDDSLPIGLLEKTMKDILMRSNKIELVTGSVSKFDYTTHLLVQKASDVAKNKNSSSFNTFANDYDDAKYIIHVQLLNYYGELVGQWQASATTL